MSKQSEQCSSAQNFIRLLQSFGLKLHFWGIKARHSAHNRWSVLSFFCRMCSILCIKTYAVTKIIPIVFVQSIIYSYEYLLVNILVSNKPVHYSLGERWAVRDSDYHKPSLNSYFSGYFFSYHGCSNWILAWFIDYTYSSLNRQLVPITITEALLVTHLYLQWYSQQSY